MFLKSNTDDYRTPRLPTTVCITPTMSSSHRTQACHDNDTRHHVHTMNTQSSSQNSGRGGWPDNQPQQQQQQAMGMQNPNAFGQMPGQNMGFMGGPPLNYQFGQFYPMMQNQGPWGGFAPPQNQNQPSTSEPMDIDEPRPCTQPSVKRDVAPSYSQARHPSPPPRARSPHPH